VRYVPAAATDFQDENIYEASHAPKEESDEEYNEMPKHTIRLTRSGRRSRNYAEQDWSDNDNDVDKDEEEEEAITIMEECKAQAGLIDIKQFVRIYLI